MNEVEQQLSKQHIKDKDGDGMHVSLAIRTARHGTARARLGPVQLGSAQQARLSCRAGPSRPTCRGTQARPEGLFDVPSQLEGLIKPCVPYRPVTCQSCHHSNNS